LSSTQRWRSAVDISAVPDAKNPDYLLHIVDLTDHAETASPVPPQFDLPAGKGLTQPTWFVRALYILGEKTGDTFL
jgi:hypothetical protein